MSTFETRPFIGLAGFFCLTISIFTAGTATAQDPTLPVLTWQHGDLTNTTGKYILTWSPAPVDGGYDFVRIEARDSSDVEEEWWPHFATGSSQEFASYAVEERVYRLRACVLTEDGGESCGAASNTVSVTSTSAVETARTPVLKSSLPAPDPARLSSIPGGAAEVLPGAYIVDGKRRTGWNLHWVNDLRCKYINPDDCIYEDVNELWMLWSTYRDFAGCDLDANPDCQTNMQPVWLVAGLRANSSNQILFEGSLHYYTVDGGDIDNAIIGEVKLIRDIGGNKEHIVRWKIDDSTFYHDANPDEWVYDDLIHQSNYEGIGVTPSPNEIDHFQGWWMTPSATTPAKKRFIWASHITNKWEFGVLAFFDGNGEPIWGAAQWGGWHASPKDTPPQNNAPFCLYAISDGTHPDIDTPDDHEFGDVMKLENGTCELHPGDDDDGEGWNLKRTYGPQEESNPDGPGQPGTMDLRIYVPAELRQPGPGGAQTLLYGPSSGGTGIMHKWVSNHEIRYFVDGDLESPNPSSCEMQNGACHLTLDWFSDGYYPYAKLYLFRKDEDENGNWDNSGIVGDWPTDGPYSVQGEPYEIAVAGTYRFELRRYPSSTSQVLAYTRQFEVTAPDAAIAITPGEHDFGDILPGDETLKTFTVTNTGPEGSSLQIQARSVQDDGFTIWTGNPGTNCNANTELSGGESCIVTVRFAATGAAIGTGPYSTTLDVESSVGEVSVPLSATVVASCAAGAGTNGLLEADPGELPILEFTEQALADTPGVFEPAWTDKQSGTKQPDIYALTRVSLDGPDEQPAVHFLSDPQARVMHYAPGSWRYTVQACQLDGKQRRCGAPSDPLTLDVSAGPERGRQPVPRPVPPGPAPQSSPPSQLAVGQYKSGLTDNNGWFFSWDSQLRFENNWEDVFELKAVWATYRNLSGSNQPGQRNLQPVWLTTDWMTPAPGNDNVYHGSLNYITVANGVKQDNWIGNVTVCLDAANQDPPRVEWEVDDTSFYESGTERTVIDELKVVYDPHADCDPDDPNNDCPPDTNDIDHYQGLWEMNDQSGYHASMFSWIIGDLETNLLAFWDDDGEPIWGFSSWGGFSWDPPQPPEQNGSFSCIYGVTDGWYPDVPYPDGQAGQNVPFGSGCVPGGLYPWNLNRKFDDLELGIDQAGEIELDITVPSDFRGENVAAFTRQTNRLPMEKIAGFHGIRFTIGGGGATDPVQCEFFEPGDCDLVLRWFTGGDYENAHLFVRRHGAGGGLTPIQGAGWLPDSVHSRFNFNFPINETGTYSFELRETDQNNSRLLTKTHQLNVFQGCQDPDFPPALGFAGIWPQSEIPPFFPWNSVGAQTVELKVWRHDDPDTLLIHEENYTGSSYQSPDDGTFVTGVDYEWQIIADHPGWCNEQESVVESFRFECAPTPEGPSLHPVQLPADNEPTPTFAWKGVSGAERYHLRVRRAGESGWTVFEKDDIDGTTLTYQVTDSNVFQMYVDYEWQIVAHNDSVWCGSADSEIESFSLEPAPMDPDPDLPPAAPDPDPGFTPDPESSIVGATAGEFRVDESGAANYSIPIMTVPGSGGVEPEIALNYNSHGGRGPLGQSWSLSGFSTISRCGQTIEQDGASTGVRLDADDRFCLDGQKLMLVPGTGAYGASGSEYRLEIDDFSRITAHGNLNGSPTHFEVRRKDGSLSTYGTPCHPGLENCSPSPSARVLTKGADPVVFAWPISRFEDSVGNFIEYLYDHPDPDWIEWVPLAVLYTGHDIFNPEPFASIEFVHIDLENPSAKANAVDTRPGEPVVESETGATTGFVAGQKVRSTQLLRTIDSFGDNDDRKRIRRYHLDYVEDAFGRPLLEGVRECWNTASNSCFNATEFQWLAGKLAIPDASTRGVYLDGFKESAKAGDVTGNGRQEAVYLFKKGDSARFAAVVNQDPNGLDLVTTPAINAECNLEDSDFRNRKADWQLMDVEGTGYQGLVYAASKCSNSDDNGIYFHRWLHVDDGLGQFTPTGIRIGALPSELDNRKVRIQVVDWNGDGLSDVLLTSPEAGNNLSRQFYLYENKSAENGKPELGDPLTFEGLEEEPPMCPPPAGGPPTFPPISVSYYISLFDTPVAEVDQSGRAAFVAKVSTYVECEGTDSEPEDPPLHLDSDEFEDWWQAQREEELQGNSYSKHRTGIFQLDEIVGDTVKLNPWPGFGAVGFDDIVIPADANGDGYTDFVLLRERQGSDSCGPGEDWVAELYLNDGRFLHDQCLFGIDSLEIAAQVRVFDYDGNGYADILVPSDHNATAAVWQVHEWLPDENGGTFSDIPYNGTWAGKLDKSLPLFLDMHGDGATDVLQFYKSGDAPGCSGVNGDWCLLATRGEIDQGAGFGKTSGFIPLNHINRITDGFGAWTHIEYKSLAQRSVYTRDNIGPYTGWGNGSVVYDVVLPMYVVAAAESLAPQANGGSSTRVEYYYAGAKLQGGGRGMLGFREIASLDVESNILTRTGYHQKFPLTGLPAFTQSSYQQPDDAWSRADEMADVEWCDDDEHLEPIIPDPEPMSTDPGTGENCMPDSIIPGDVLGMAVNTWAVLETGTQHPYLARSEEWSLTPWSTTSGTFQGRVFTHRVVTENNNLDAWGNPGEVVVSTYTSEEEGSTEDLVARQTTVNRYDPAQLHLGRLTSATVTSERPGKVTHTRISTFSYDPATGILDRETIGASHWDDTVGKLTTTYILDDFGNREETRVTGDGIDRRSLKLYDSNGRFVNTRRVWIEGGWQTTETVNQRDRYGNPTLVTDGRGVVTKQGYDHMGRPHYTYTSDGAWSRVLYTTDFDPLACPSQTAYLELQEAAGGEPIEVNSDMRLDGGTTQICRDRLGRQTRTRTRAFNGGWNHVDTDYDYASRVAQVSEPYHCTPQQQCESRLWNQTTYDIAGQPVRVMHADGEAERWEYLGLTTEHTNQRGKVHAVTTNPMGEKVMETAADDGVTLYDYDALGQLTETDGPLPGTQDLITIGYDDLGHKLWMNDPDKGDWEYRHNALGELQCQKDDEGRGVKMIYDELGRLEMRWDFSFVNNLDDCTGTVAGISEWAYGDNSGQTNFGQLTGEKSDFNDNGEAGTDPIVVPQGTAPGPSRAFERDYDYDAYGRVKEVVTRIDDGGAVRTYTERTTYDEFSRVFQQFDASGDSRGIRYHYNPRGYVLSLQEAREGGNARTYWSVLEQDARGNVTEALLGNGITVHATHDSATGRLMDLQTSGGQELAQDLALEWDTLGNLTYRYDYSAGPAQLECFEYDDRDRLQEVKHPANINQACENVTSSFISVDYDKSGNITYKSDVGGYDYGTGNAGPHAVTSAGDRTFTYDDVGNVISDSLSRTYHYTTFNQLRSVTRGGNSTYFYYGPNREKVIKHDQQGSTHYVGNVEIARADGPAGSREYRRYIGGVALVTFYAESGNTRQRYLHKDHLGSVTAITDESGYVVARMAYDPWGQRRNPEDLSQPWEQWAQLNPPDWGTLPNAMLGFTPRGYTGHEQVDDHGVVLMGARVYDPRLGRFLQADPFVEDSTTLNRYTYVHNNPLVYTDPSGYLSVKEVVTIAAVVVVSVYTGGAAAGAWGFFGASSLSAGQAFAVAVAGGALAGGISTGTWEGAAWGAFSAAAFYGIGQAFAGVADPTGGGIFNTGLSGPQFAMQSLSHGVVGGMISHMQGGKFGHGFISAGVTKASTPAISTIGNTYAEGVAAAIVGGTTSRLTGGKFENGAATAAMAYAFNELASSSNDEASERWSENEIARARERAVAAYWRRVKGMSVEGFLEAFPNSTEHPVIGNNLPSQAIRDIALYEVIRHQLAVDYIAYAKRYTKEQIVSVYGEGAFGAAIGGLPRAKAVWDIYTHPRPPSWQIWNRGWRFWRRPPEVTVGCNVGQGTCQYSVR